MLLLVALLSMVGYAILGYGGLRAQHIWFYPLLFSLLVGLIASVQLAGHRQQISLLILAGMLCRILLVPTVPWLSDDYLRFVFDGDLGMRGINPFAHLPSEHTELMRDAETRQLLAPDAKNFYTTYPPFCQSIFALGSALGATTASAVMIMKAILVLFEAITILGLRQLLARRRMPDKWVLWYALNPLPILEIAGNAHFEGVMLCWLVIGFLLIKRLWWLGGVAFGLAIATKLYPIVLLPLVLRYLGWTRTIGLTGIAIGTFVLLLTPFDPLEAIRHMQESAKLYYSYFEFNGGLYALIRELAMMHYGYVPAAGIGKLMAIITAAFFLLTGLFQRSGYGAMIGATAMAITGYQLLATTVNPWYIIPALGLGVVSGIRAPLAWASLVLLSYSSLTPEGLSESSWLLLTQYIPVWVLFLYALPTVMHFRGHVWLHAPLRAALKWPRLRRHLKGRSLLDIGAGNGALALRAKECGYDVAAYDIADRSVFAALPVKTYDGKKLPLGDQTMDNVFLITVLHHCPDPRALLVEAARVGRRLIIMEDVYRSGWQEKLTKWVDSLVNLEFRGHPHTNQDTAGWLNTFDELGLPVVYQKESRFMGVFRQAVFVLEAPLGSEPKAAGKQH